MRNTKPVTERSNVEINVRAECKVEPDHERLQSVVEAWQAFDKVPPLFAWAEVFDVPQKAIKVQIVEREGSASATILIDN